jgi:hypothetical protein
MLRKFMAAVAVCSVPVLSFGVAEVATSGSAFAAGGTTLCSGGSQAVTFAAPGISNQGTASASAKSTSMTSAAPSITCTGKHAGTGTVPASKIKTKTTVTCANDTNTKPSPCPTGDFVYDSAIQFASGGSTLFKAVKTTTWTVGSTTYVAANTSSATAGSGTGVGNCPSAEAGFELTGHLTAPASQSGKATHITVCLNTDTGSGGTTNNFKADVTSEVLGNTTLLITSAGFDGSTSSIQFA